LKGRALSVVVGLAVLFGSHSAFAGSPELVIGSKRFTESLLMAELAARAAAETGTTVRQARGLGGTAIVFAAIESGAIDVYPDYVGTLAEAVLGLPGRPDREGVAKALSARGLCLTEGLGFENTYALAVRKDRASTLGVQQISDLSSHPELVVGVSNEMAGRPDGWPGLAAAYGLTVRPRAMDHGLAYEAIRDGAIDVVEVYSTDAKVERFGLRTLRDDRRFFPSYEAVFVYRCEARARFPRAIDRVLALAGTLDASRVTRWNAMVELDGLAPTAALDGGTNPLSCGDAPRAGRASLLAELLDVVRHEGPTHVGLVLGSVLASVLVGVPLGVLARRSPRLRGPVLAAAGVLQTIPSLALLCFLIPLLGIGTLPTLVALFVYGLLPIVTNTYQGLTDVPPALRESAIVLGLSERQRLGFIELPLAARAIVAGVRTSAVVAVGTATIAAFAGAGGFGQPISTGLNLNDTKMILSGAIPAALLALGVGAVFGAIDRRLARRLRVDR
jgi:osmoprotectant transport system permease protein